MIYEPREDTYLILNEIKKKDLKAKEALEIGTGSGLIAEKMLEKKAEVTASDINTEALNQLPSEIQSIKSNLFENIEEKYDLIVFNPPYLPGEEKESDMEASETWYGGEKGIEVTEKFLDKSSKYLKEGGECLIILSSLAEIDDLIEEYDLDIVNEKKIWFETLYLARYSLE